jgi:hypothetical protein
VKIGNKLVYSIIVAALIMGAALYQARPVYAGSCCGGGSPANLLVPKYARAVFDISFDMELYDGFWDQDGKHIPDPPDSDLSQYRLNLGFAYRFSRRLQASIIIPYVWNSNKYSGLSSHTSGLGDSSLSLWYEPLEDASPWRIKTLKDMVPSVNIGPSLLIPTGISPYDDVENSFDVCGRGFYRIDGNLLIEKTLQPWNLSVLLSYGKYLERPVNREYGKYVEPYDKAPGDRISGTVSLSYAYYIGSGGDTLTGSLSYTYLHEKDAKINGTDMAFSGFKKKSLGGSIVYSGTDSDWSFRGSWSHTIKRDGWGENFPSTDIFTVGVRYAFR